jgi:hypothetical protein
MGDTPITIIIETELVTSGEKAVYHYLLIEKSWVAPLDFTGNIRRVVCTINGELSFQCSLMPNGKGQYYISVNKENRTRLGIEPGDRVHVELQRDQSKYGLPMPEELQAVLDDDPEGDKLFHALTNGKQRTLLYFVGKQKDIDRRIDSALIILEHLKDNDGKIDYRKLYHELKRPAFGIK